MHIHSKSKFLSANGVPKTSFIRVSTPAFLPLGDDRHWRRSLKERVRVAALMLLVVSALVGSAVEVRAQSTNLWTSGSGNLSTIGITNDSNLTFNNPGYTATVTNNAQVTALTEITFNAGAGTNTLTGSSAGVLFLWATFNGFSISR
jgi:hypothetical protein